MTEQELNNRIAEILESTKAENGCGRRTGRQYRRSQSIRHSDRLLFLIQNNDLASLGSAHSVYEVQQPAAVSEAERESKSPEISLSTKEREPVS